MTAYNKHGRPWLGMHATTLSHIDTRSFTLDVVTLTANRFKTSATWKHSSRACFAPQHFVDLYKSAGLMQTPQLTVLSLMLTVVQSAASGSIKQRVEPASKSRTILAERWVKKISGNENAY